MHSSRAALAALRCIFVNDVSEPKMTHARVSIGVGFNYGEEIRVLLSLYCQLTKLTLRDNSLFDIRKLECNSDESPKSRFNCTRRRNFYFKT